MRRAKRATISLIVWGLLIGACGIETPPIAGPNVQEPRATAVATSSTTAPPATVPTSEVPGTTVPSSKVPTVTITPPPSSSDPEPQTPSTTKPPSAGSIEPGLAPFVELAVADLASRLGVSEPDITVIAAEMVVWPDSALGCPAPGMAYTQVLVDGFRILLGVGKAQFAYHGGGTRGPFLCESPQP